jgi:integron integrase
MPTTEQWKNKSPLIQKMRDTMRTLHMSRRTEEAYVHWCCDLFAWSKCSRVECLDGKLVESFLSHLAINRKVSASTQNQAFNALLFLFRRVIGKEFGEVSATRAKVSKHIPEWLTVDEVKSLLATLDGEWKTLTRLGFGTGLRLMELLRLRVKDIQFSSGTIYVRDGKGAKDRIVMLPKSCVDDLKKQIEFVKAQHEKDLAQGYGEVWMPNALAIKYPNASKQIGWQYLFPSRTLCEADGTLRRHHLFANGFQTALRLAAKKAGISKRVHPHVLRHSFATAFLQNGGSLQTLQGLLGHKDVKTTMIYTHCLQARDAKSPADLM